MWEGPECGAIWRDRQRPDPVRPSFRVVVKNLNFIPNASQWKPSKGFKKGMDMMMLITRINTTEHLLCVSKVLSSVYTLTQAILVTDL